MGYRQFPIYAIKMQAIQLLSKGPSSILTASQIPIPQPLANQLLIKNAFSGINFIDVYHRNGLYPVKFPFIPGREASGIIEAVGEDLKNDWKVGDRVAYASSFTYAQ